MDSRAIALQRVLVDRTPTIGGFILAAVVIAVIVFSILAPLFGVAHLSPTRWTDFVSVT